MRLRDQPILNGLEEIDQFHKIAEWEKTTETGDRVEIVGLPESSPLWQKLDARTEHCLGQSCPDWERCFITEMRRKALESDIVIVNHHLFFADLGIKLQARTAPDAGILPEAAVVIFDEAHELEDVASNYFGVGLSNMRFEELVRDLETMLRTKITIATSVMSAGQTVRERARMFFGALPQDFEGRAVFSQREEFLESFGDIYLGLMNALHRLEGELERVRGVDETPGLRKRVADIREHLKFLMESGIEEHCLLAGAARERAATRRGERNTYLQATPIDVSGLMQELLFESYLVGGADLGDADGGGRVSDTFASGWGWRRRRSWWCRRTSAIRSRRCCICRRRCRTRASRALLQRRRSSMRRVLEITRGRAFCLFTSYAQMRDLYERLLMELEFPLLLQGTAPKKALLEEFRATPNAVLFGTSSFWQGVDVQGESLSCVIVDRLPFAVPSDPVVAARMRAIEEDGPQRVLRVPGAAGGDHAEAGLWAADPLARRSRRADAAGPAAAAAAIRQGVSGQSAALSGDEGYC